MARHVIRVGFLHGNKRQAGTDNFLERHTRLSWVQAKPAQPSLCCLSDCHRIRREAGERNRLCAPCAMCSTSKALMGLGPVWPKLKLRSIDAMMKPYGMLYKALQGKACGPDTVTWAPHENGHHMGPAACLTQRVHPSCCPGRARFGHSQSGCHSPSCAHLGPASPTPRLPMHIT